MPRSGARSPVALDGRLWSSVGMTIPSPVPRTGGQILADQLRIHGVDTVFGVPGESYLAVLDALHDHTDAIRFIVCRQEGGAAMMAEAQGKLTGRPGICMVTRGPGATNASAGVHIAHQDSTPMVLFIGQIASDTVEREAFQEVDYRRMFGPLCKWVAQIDDPARIPELVHQAFQRATSGRPGPVVLALPEDMLTSTATVADAPRYRPAQAYPNPLDVAKARDLLAQASRPLVIVGGSGWSQETQRQIQDFAAANSLPVAVSFRRQAHIDHRHPSFAGTVGIGIDPALQKRIGEADLLLVIGSRIGEMASQGYTLLGIPTPKQTLIHVLSGAEEVGRVYAPTLGINACSAGFVAALAALSPVAAPPWKDWTASAHADAVAFAQPLVHPGPVQIGAIVADLRATLPDDAIITNGAGNYATWVHRHFPFHQYGSQLAPTSGSMGYGAPSAIGAKLLHPGRTVVSFSGDGCFLMHGQEFATAMQYGAAVIFIVVDNGMYGTIRMHQEREYPARVSGTMLTNPDFAAYARAFGGHGETVLETSEFAAAFERATASGKPALIHLKIDPEAITPKLSLSQIRATAQAKQAG